MIRLNLCFFVQYLIDGSQVKRLVSSITLTYFKDIIMKKVIIASLTAMFVLTGCNTLKGFGQDVSSAGDAVTGTAQEVQKKI